MTRVLVNKAGGEPPRNDDFVTNPMDPYATPLYVHSIVFKLITLYTVLLENSTLILNSFIFYFIIRKDREKVSACMIEKS